MDITHKGKTLKRFANLLSDYMGIDSDRILQIDIVKTLNKIDADNQKDSDKSIFEDKAVFNYTVAEADGRIGKLSSTPHFDILDDSRNDESKGHIKSEGKTAFILLFISALSILSISSIYFSLTSVL